MKISVYTRSGETSPSSYYRILQYAKKWPYKTYYHQAVSTWIYDKRNEKLYTKIGVLWKIGYYLDIYINALIALITDIIVRPECVIISREIFPIKLLFGYDKLYEKVLRNAKKVIWDFDDDIFESKEISKKEKDLLYKYTTRIIVTHARLKEKLPDDQKNKTVLLFTTDGNFQNSSCVKTIHYRTSKLDNEIELIWVATQASLRDLDSVIPWLDDAAKVLKLTYNKEVVLNVVCNIKVKYNTKYLIIKNTKWSRAIVPEAMERAQIGIMPLLDNPFNRGKGGFKLIQYMANSLPVIASPVGINNEIVKPDFGILAKTKDEWVNGIIFIALDKVRYINMSKMSRTFFEDKYSFENNLKNWIDIIKGETDEYKN